MLCFNTSMHAYTPKNVYLCCMYTLTALPCTGRCQMRILYSHTTSYCITPRRTTKTFMYTHIYTGTHIHTYTLALAGKHTSTHYTHTGQNLTLSTVHGHNVAHSHLWLVCTNVPCQYYPSVTWAVGCWLSNYYHYHHYIILSLLNLIDTHRAKCL